MADMANFARDNIGRVNILIMGKTGNGKSTLINELFDCRMAPEITGPPTKMTITEYPRSHDPVDEAFQHLRLVDTRGIELGNAKANVKEVEKFLRRRNSITDASQHIHIVLHTVLAPGNRFEEYDEMMVKMVMEMGIGIIVVLTQAYTDVNQRNELKQYITSRCPTVDVVPVLARAMQFCVLHPYGLDELAELILHKLPNQCRLAFAAVQRRLKREKAYAAVMWYIVGGALLGALPLPFVTMPPFIGFIFYRIATVYEVALVQGVSNVTRLGGVGAATSAAAALDFSPIVAALNALQFNPLIGAIIGGLSIGLFCTLLIETFDRIYKERSGNMSDVTVGDIIGRMPDTILDFIRKGGHRDARFV